MGSKGKSKTTLDKPWFDKDCKQARNKLKLLGKDIKDIKDITQNPQNDNLRKNYAMIKKYTKS